VQKLQWKSLPRRLRVSRKAVLIPLLTVVLGAWLIPAFTRQWDDRQKARALQASVARTSDT
jgi:hypothetical protein